MPLRAYLFAIAALLSVGCFDGHGRGDDAGPPSSGFDGGEAVICECCGTQVPWVGDCRLGACDGICNFAPDAGPGPTPTCTSREPRALDVMCPTYIPAGTPQTIPVAIGGEGQCYCGETVECSARRGTDPFVLEIDSAICSGDLLCDGCFPYLEGQCELPSLEEGQWTVRSGGQDLFHIDVVSAGVMPEWGLECHHRRADDELGCGHDWPPRTPIQPSQICHPGGGFEDQRLTLTVTDNCSSCGTIVGPCEVEVFDDVLRVRPSRVETNCDIDCPSICMRQEHTCISPPLPAGTWRVFLGDIPMATEIEVVSGGEPPDIDEICGMLPGG